MPEQANHNPLNVERSFDRLCRLPLGTRAPSLRNSRPPTTIVVSAYGNRRKQR